MQLKGLIVIVELSQGNFCALATNQGMEAKIFENTSLEKVSSDGFKHLQDSFVTTPAPTADIPVIPDPEPSDAEAQKALDNLKETVDKVKNIVENLPG